MSDPLAIRLRDAADEVDRRAANSDVKMNRLAEMRVPEYFTALVAECHDHLKQHSIGKHRGDFRDCDTPFCEKHRGFAADFARLLGPPLPPDAARPEATGEGVGA